MIKIPSSYIALFNSTLQKALQRKSVGRFRLGARGVSVTLIPGKIMEWLVRTLIKNKGG